MRLADEPMDEAGSVSEAPGSSLTVISSRFRGAEKSVQAQGVVKEATVAPRTEFEVRRRMFREMGGQGMCSLNQTATSLLASFAHDSGGGARPDCAYAPRH